MFNVALSRLTHFAVSVSLNSSISNGPFSGKRVAYDTSLALTRELRPEEKVFSEEFTPHACRQRAARIHADALSFWCLPTAATEEAAPGPVAELLASPSALSAPATAKPAPHPAGTNHVPDVVFVLKAGGVTYHKLPTCAKGAVDSYSYQDIMQSNFVACNRCKPIENKTAAGKIVCCVVC